MVTKIASLSQALGSIIRWHAQTQITFLTVADNVNLNERSNLYKSKQSLHFPTKRQVQYSHRERKFVTGVTFTKS